jgi:hypothetical protein
VDAGRVMQGVRAGLAGRLRGWALGLLGVVFVGWLLFASAAGSFTATWLAGCAALTAASVLVWLPSAPARRWRRFVIETSDLHLLGVALAFVLAAPGLPGPPGGFASGVSSDGAVYFGYLRSMVFDHDLSIARELDFLSLPPRVHFIMPVGPMIVWAPLYLVVALVDWLSFRLGLPTSAPFDSLALGLTGPYVRAVLVSTWMCASAGLLALHWRLRSEFGRAPALIASLLILGATPLTWYLLHEFSMTHGPSFGLIALALVGTAVWFVRGVPTAPQSAAIGVLIGLALLVRPQDGLFGLFPLAAAVAGVRHGSVRQWARPLIVLALSFAPFIVVQVAWGRVIMAHDPHAFALVGQTGYLNLAASRWLEVLFSSRHGLFSWTPIVTVAAIGTVAYLRRNPVWAIPAVAVFAGMCWVNGSTVDWAAGSAFGGRRFVSSLAALSPGLALVVAAAARRPMFVIAPLAAVIIVWNQFLMQLRQEGTVPSDEAVRFDWLVRQQVEVYLRPPYFYPFAFPANAWFAWREGVPIDAYDLLGVEPLHEKLDLTLDDKATRFAPTGWRRAGKDSFGARWFLMEDSGTLVVPLSPPATRPYALAISARAEHPDPNAPPCEVIVEVNGAYLGTLRLDPTVPTPASSVFGTRPGASDRVWRTGYNHLTFRRVVSIRQSTEDNPPARVIVYELSFGPRDLDSSQ